MEKEKALQTRSAARAMLLFLGQDTLPPDHNSTKAELPTIRKPPKIAAQYPKTFEI